MTQLTVLPLPTDEPRADVLLFPEAHATRVNASGMQSDGSSDEVSSINPSGSESALGPVARRSSGVVAKTPNDPPSSSRFRPLRAVAREPSEPDKRLVELVRDQHRAVWRTLRRLGVP